MNVKQTLSAFFLLFSISLAAAPDLKHAYALLDQGQPGEALALVDSLIRADGRTRSGLQARVEVLNAMGRYDQALEDALSIEKTNPRKSPWDCILVADTFLKMSKPEEALNWLNLAVDRKFKSIQVLSDSLYDPVRNTESFASLVERIQKNIGIGLPAKNIHASCMDGTSFDLSGKKGKVILIDFFATWCGPCREEMPNLKNLYGRYNKKGLEILGISLDKDRTRLEEYVEKENLTWKITFSGKEWNDEHALSYEVNSIPSIWLIDRQGLLRGFDCRGEDLAEQIRQLLEEK